jgi:hypothetical protein
VRPAKPRSRVGVPVSGPVTDRDFDALVAPHAAVLMAIAARLVGTDDAADVVQEALLRSWRRWSTFDPAKGTLRARRHRRGLPRADLRMLTDLPDVPVSTERRDAARPSPSPEAASLKSCLWGAGRGAADVLLAASSPCDSTRLPVVEQRT